MARAKLGPMQIRHTQLDAEGLSSRVNPNKESIQYGFLTRLISSMKRKVGKNKNRINSHCFS